MDYASVVKLSRLHISKYENSDEEMKLIEKEHVQFNRKRIYHGTVLRVKLYELLQIISNTDINLVFKIDIYKSRWCKNLLYKIKHGWKYRVEFHNKKVRIKGFTSHNGLINTEILKMQTRDSVLL